MRVPAVPLSAIVVLAACCLLPSVSFSSSFVVCDKDVVARGPTWRRLQRFETGRQSGLSADKQSRASLEVPRGLNNDKSEPPKDDSLGASLNRLSRKRRSPRLKSSVRKGAVLAQRPKTSTSTTTTTTTTTPDTPTSTKTEEAGTEKSPSKSSEPNEDENSSAGDAYEYISGSPGGDESAANTKLKASATTTEAPEEEEADQEQVDESSDYVTSTTSTSTPPPPPRKSKYNAKKPAKANKPKGRSKSVQSDYQEEENEVAARDADNKSDNAKGSQPDTKESGESKTGDGDSKPNTTSASISGNDKTAKRKKKKPLVVLPFIKPKNSSVCIPEAYLEFPRDLIGDKWRGRGLVVIHMLVAIYMFYSLALVCERYFMPSLETFSERLGLSEDVAGATLMSAGSSAPELFTAILGVFVAKGDVGTGAIVGSAVFNILFVIGVCAFVSTTTAQLNWWPVLRDSIFYSFTVLVLILFIYDERITAIESFLMIALYGVYILIMAHNEAIKKQVTQTLQSYPVTAKLLRSAVSVDSPDDVFAGGSSSSMVQNYQTTSLATGRMQTHVEDDSVFLAAQLIIVRHKRLFRSQIRFQSAARYIIVKRQHRQQQQQQKSIKCSNEVNYFGPESEPLRPGTDNGGASQSAVANQRERMEAYARGPAASRSKFSIVSKDDYEFWNRPPGEGENYYLWLAKIPVNYVLHYTIPDCALYPDKYVFTFFISILWTALFSYIMVWMITLIGYTFGIPDSVMGMTFLAAGTSVPDCYSSVHAARNGMADMAVSNSIGSNVFDILIGLSLPWFLQTAVYPGVVATINSRGVIYSVILLFLSLIITIYLLNQYEWTLKPRLGLALLIAYGLFIVLTCMLEFNLFGHVNPPPCPVA